jgi:hypothetical protein
MLMGRRLESAQRPMIGRPRTDGKKGRKQAAPQMSRWVED